MGDNGENGDNGWGHTEPQEPSLIVKAAVKEKLGDKNVSSDFYDELNKEVVEMLYDAAQRAKNNERKTVQPQDL